MTKDAFDRLMPQLDHPMFIVTTAVNGSQVGCLVGFAAQASIHPPRFLVALSVENHTFAVASAVDFLAVHVLARRDHGLAVLFGSETGDETDKFAQCAWHTGPEGMPILDRAPAWFVGKVLSRFAMGDHVGYLLQPVAAQAPAKLEGVVMFSDVGDIKPGHPA